MNQKTSKVLTLLKITPSEVSKDYVNNKKQFQLHTLLTEQRHKKTWNLSFVIKENIEEGLKMIFSVDEDIVEKYKQIVENEKYMAILNQASDAIANAILNKRKIYVYGCGSTGRLSKQMESAIWKPFWRKVKSSSLWKKLSQYLPNDIDEKLIGEMTGGDRALISALEGFEDLQLIGKLQLQDRGVQKGDVVFCITEGGETSSVIGTILAAAEQYGELTEQTIQEARKNLYFIYNNPNEVLQPFIRSKTVIEHPAITKINLTTGPQAITGSTRMQATTSETYLLGVIIENGIYKILKKYLTEDELSSLGYKNYAGIKERLLYFSKLREYILQQLPLIAKFTHLEYTTYKSKNFASYFAKQALIAVFIDCAERSPTFRLFPLDTIYEPQRKCWVQVFTEGKNYKEAWYNFLGRNFYGLKKEFYKPEFEQKIDDPFLKQTALNSLENATQEQEQYYDFSFSEENLSRESKKINKGDLSVAILLDEEIEELVDPQKTVYKFINLSKQNQANVCIITVSNIPYPEVFDKVNKILSQNDVMINFVIADSEPDPLKLNKQILLKVLLNAHSTAVMTLLGRVVGNTMVFVNASNLKLIGRATYLITSHVNDTITKDYWKKNFGETEPITYEEANAVLFDAIDYLKKHPQQIGEVALSIIRILECLKKNSYISYEEAIKIIETEGLENYLLRHNPSLKPQIKEV
jgi:N-acetylmuramic acid 6-phosphate (MurNAc-6-P) etherase